MTKNNGNKLVIFSLYGLLDFPQVDLVVGLRAHAVAFDRAKREGNHRNDEVVSERQLRERFQRRNQIVTNVKGKAYCRGHLESITGYTK